MAILAIFLVAGAIGPWPFALRIGSAAGAVCIALLLFTSRLRDHGHTSSNDATDAAWARIDRIREARARRR